MATEYGVHPVADYLPEYTAERYEMLRDSIKGYGGLRQPITVIDGLIVDGRHRYRACVELGLEPWVVELEAGVDPLDAAVDLNGVRRQLNSAQRAMYAARISADSQHGGDRRSEDFQDTNLYLEGKNVLKNDGEATYSQERAAKSLGVALGAVRNAKAIIAYGDKEIIADVNAGKLKISPALERVKARQEAKELERQRKETELRQRMAGCPEVFIRAVIDEVVTEHDAMQSTERLASWVVAAEWAGNVDIDAEAVNALALYQQDKPRRVSSLPSAVRLLWREWEAANPRPLPPDVYDVVVIDPPWEARDDGSYTPRASQFASPIYPDMTLDQIKGLPVPELLADDAWVLLWALPVHLLDGTAKGLAESWGLKIWGVPMIWHKGDVGYKPPGQFQRNYEPILVCRKGKPTLVDETGFQALFTAPWAGASVKPDAFYDMVRRCFGGARRLDMFNRREIEGFDVWGNEVDGNQS